MSKGMRYICNSCGASDVKLWRPYNTVLDALELLCLRCAQEDQGKEITDESDQVGWFVPAVPTELPNESRIIPKDASFWGYTSVPDWGIKWWYDLPPTIPAPHPETQRRLMSREEEHEMKMQQLRLREQQIQRKIDETIFLVEASHNEVHHFWRMWHTVLNMEQDYAGISEEVGRLGKQPVMVTVFWYRIQGKLVGFYEGTSNVVDHRMIEKWVEETFPIFKKNNQEGKQHPNTNMSNIHLMIDEVAPDWSKDPAKLRQFNMINAILR